MTDSDNQRRLLDELHREAWKRMDKVAAPSIAAIGRELDEADGGRGEADVSPSSVERTKAVAASSRTRIRGSSFLPHFDRLLLFAGLSEPTKLAEASGEWELWSAGEPQPLLGTHRVVGVVLLLTPATEERVRAIEREIASSTFRSVPLTVVLSDKLHEPRVREQLGSSFRGVHVITVRALLGNVLSKLVCRPAREVRRETMSFVDPGLDAEGLPFSSAVETLLAFLEQEGESSAVGVLLGPAGAGKSTVASEIARAPRRKAASRAAESTPGAEMSSPTTVRLLVADDYWLEIEKRGSAVTADGVLREALRSHGFDRDDLGQIDVLLANGVLTLIFDSFDEVCSHGPGTSPNEVLERILQLTELENSRARILITSRAEFWALVDPALKAQCCTFSLLPFDEQHLETYLDRRFAKRSAPRQRVEAALANLAPETRRIPIVVATIADAIDADVDVVQYLEESGEGIRRSNALPGVARIMFAREQSKHRLALPPDTQALFFTMLAAEYGYSFSAAEIVDVAQIEFSLTVDEAAKLTRHFMFLPRGEAAVGDFTFRYPEMAQAVVSTALVRALGELGSKSASFTRRRATLLRQLLVRTQTDFPAIIERIGPELQSLSSEERRRIWEHRNELQSFPDAQSSLFRILVASQEPDSNGYRQPAFLPMDGSFHVASNYVQKGSLKKIDLRTVRFVSVQFRDAELASCRFSGVSEFRNCVLVKCRIGGDCDDLTPQVLLTAEFDEETIGLSKRWIQFPQLRPEVLAKVALQRVVYRVLEVAGDSAFTLGRAVAEDALEEHVLDILKQLYIVKEKPWPVIDSIHQTGARKLVNHGEMIGTFQQAFRAAATWTSRNWNH